MTWPHGRRSSSTIRPLPLADNRKPILYAAGEKDALAPRAAVERMASGIGGPVEIEIVAGAPHQLMLFATATFSDLVHGFCTKNLRGSPQ